MNFLEWLKLKELQNPTPRMSRPPRSAGGRSSMYFGPSGTYGHYAGPLAPITPWSPRRLVPAVVAPIGDLFAKELGYTAEPIRQLMDKPTSEFPHSDDITLPLMMPAELDSSKPKYLSNYVDKMVQIYEKEGEVAFLQKHVTVASGQIDINDHGKMRMAHKYTLELAKVALFNRLRSKGLENKFKPHYTEKIINNTHLAVVAQYKPISEMDK